MAILVTGGSGFVGLNLVERLLGRGESVVALGANPAPAAALAELSRLPGRLAAIEGDVRDGAELARLMAAHGVDRIIHAAAITAGEERDREAPRLVAEVNYLGTVAVLEAARRQGVERIVYAGTGAVYGAAGLLAEGLLDEAEHLPVPGSLYGISKYAAERTCLRLKALWGLDLVVARLAMAFGPWEHESGLRDRMSLPLQATRLAEAGAEAVLPDAEFRDWIYAPDLAEGLVMLLDAPAPAQDLYHLGAGAPWPVSAWCDRLARVHPGFRWRVSREPEEWTVVPLGGGRTPFAARRIREELGFRPRHGLDEAFADYRAWRARHPL